MKSVIVVIIVLLSLSVFSPVALAVDATPSATPTNSPPICLGLSANPGAGSKPLTVNFACAGYDANNDITAAEFGFGGDQKRLVEKNVGQYGSLTTTYTYTTPGSYDVTCHVRDNNNSFSSYPSYCTYTIIVSDNALTPTPMRTPIPTPTFEPTSFPTRAPTLIPTNTPYIVTPTPTPIPNWWSNDKVKQLMIMLAVSGVTVAVALTLHAFFDKRSN